MPNISPTKISTYTAYWSTPLLNYCLAIQALTTTHSPNFILPKMFICCIYQYFPSPTFPSIYGILKTILF